MKWLFRFKAFLLTCLAINIYNGIRILGFIRHFLPTFNVFIFWPLHFIICYLFVLVLLLRLDHIRSLRQVSMYSLPFYVYFFFAQSIIDVFKYIAQYFYSIPDAYIVSVIGTGTALVLAALSIVYGSINSRKIRTVNYSISINKKGRKSLRIDLISDLHIGTTVNRKWVSNIVNAVNKAEPDIVIMAGDIFDNRIDAIKEPDKMTAELKRFKSPLGVYACPGNHDVDRASLTENSSTERIGDFLSKADISFLQDEVKLITDSFYLVGRRDIRPIGLRKEPEPDSLSGANAGSSSSVRKTADELTSGLDKTKPIIFMDHQPLDYPKIEEAGGDLIFSGHTHRGQFFPGNLVTRRMFKKAGAAHYGHWRGSKAQGVITSGVAVWGPAFRIGTGSEVAVININFSKYR